MIGACSLHHRQLPPERRCSGTKACLPVCMQEGAPNVVSRIQKFRYWERESFVSSCCAHNVRRVAADWNVDKAVAASGRSNSQMCEAGTRCAKQEPDERSKRKARRRIGFRKSGRGSHSDGRRPTPKRGIESKNAKDRRC